MAKKVVKVLKLNLPAGSATPAPPVGPILGQAGINMMQFLKEYNERTSKDPSLRGQVIPAEITIYQDKSFTFELKLPPVADMIKQTLKLKSGSKTAGKETIGTLSKDQVRAIAEKKLPDLNTRNLDSAINTVTGTAKSMGVKISA